MRAFTLLVIFAFVQPVGAIILGVLAWGKVAAQLPPTVGAAPKGSRNSISVSPPTHHNSTIVEK